MNKRMSRMSRIERGVTGKNHAREWETREMGIDLVPERRA